MSILDKHFARPYYTSTTSDHIIRLSTSWLLPPFFLLALRALISIYAFTVLFFNLAWDSTHGDSLGARQSFSYFTVLTYWGLAFYFAFAAAHTGSYAVRGRAWLQDWPRVLQWAHSVFYGTVTVFPFVVTGVFWAVLAKNAFVSEYSTWSNISEHALNSCLAFLEIILVRSKPHPPINVLPLIVILACYLGLAYLSHATWGFYVYGFLDPAIGRGKVAGACIGILAASIIVFFIVSGLIWIRRWLTEGVLGMNGMLSSHDPDSHNIGRSDLEAVEFDVAPKAKQSI